MARYEVPRDTTEVMDFHAGPIRVSLQLLLVSGVITLVVVDMIIAVISIVATNNDWAWVPPLWTACAVPLAIFVTLVLIPVWIDYMHAARSVPSAIKKTSYALEQRADWVVDLNRRMTEIYIPGERNVLQAPSQTVEPRLLTINSSTGAQELLLDRAMAVSPIAENAPEGPIPTQIQIPIVRQWRVQIPNPNTATGEPMDVMILEDHVREFVEGIYRVGWERKHWSPKPFTRPQYEALMKLCTDLHIIGNRVQGRRGDLLQRDAAMALIQFGLTP